MRRGPYKQVGVAAAVLSAGAIGWFANNPDHDRDPVRGAQNPPTMPAPTKPNTTPAPAPNTGPEVKPIPLHDPHSHVAYYAGVRVDELHEVEGVSYKETLYTCLGHTLVVNTVSALYKKTGANGSTNNFSTNKTTYDNSPWCEDFQVTPHDEHKPLAAPGSHIQALPPAPAISGPTGLQRPA